MEEEQHAAQIAQQELEKQSEARMETLRNHLTSKFMDQTNQMDSKMRTLRIETATQAEELELTARELRAKLEEERQSFKISQRNLKSEVEEQKQELQKSAEAIEKADKALRQMDQTWHTVSL